jgi:hypothetical protein
MALDLFGAPTGGSATKLESGAPDYQGEVYNQATRRLKPMYQTALKGLRQNYASRGLYDSGLMGQAEGDLAQGYAGKLQDVATESALKGADISEQRRRRDQDRAWAIEDRNARLNYLREEADRREAQAGADRWANLLSGVAGAAGGGAGRGLWKLLSPKDELADPIDYLDPSYLGMDPGLPEYP